MRWKGGDWEEKSPIPWLNSPVARILFGRKYSLPLLICLYQRGSIGTCGAKRQLDGSPETILALLRELGSVGVIFREPQSRSYHTLQINLTAKGIQLVETPIYCWGKLIGKWDRML